VSLSNPNSTVTSGNFMRITSAAIRADVKGNRAPFANDQIL